VVGPSSSPQFTPNRTLAKTMEAFASSIDDMLAEGVLPIK